VDDEAAKGAEAAVLAWAKAWANKDMANYLAAYGPEFSPGGQQSRSAWEKDRRDRIMGKSRITVTLNNLSVKVTGDVAEAKFHQAYKSDALSVKSRKTLTLRNNGKRWLITRESTGN
jgi:ketosteroid isomerase-like protein